MLKNTMIAMLFVGTLVVTLSSRSPYVEAGSEARASSPDDCEKTCNDCVRSCDGKSMGCNYKCAADMGACCIANGKKPGSPTNCVACQ